MDHAPRTSIACPEEEEVEDTGPGFRDIVLERIRHIENKIGEEKLKYKSVDKDLLQESIRLRSVMNTGRKYHAHRGGNMIGNGPGGVVPRFAPPARDPFVDRLFSANPPLKPGVKFPLPASVVVIQPRRSARKISSAASDAKAAEVAKISSAASDAKAASETNAKHRSLILRKAGAVEVGGVLLSPENFRYFKGPNHVKYLVNVHGICFDPFTNRWAARLIFAEYPGVYSRYEGIVELGPDFEPVISLHRLNLDLHSWWLLEDKTVPAVTVVAQPGETATFPRPKGVYKPSDSVVVLHRVGGPARGYVHSWYKTDKDEVFYHVFIVTEDQVDPSLWKGVYKEEELGPAPITWKAIRTADVWWIRHSQYYIEHMRPQYLYWPEPEQGWQPGHLVSVPFDSNNTRQLARVVYCYTNEGRKRIVVVFPVIEGMPVTHEEAIREDYPADYLLGPHIHWTLDLYRFHEKLKRKTRRDDDEASPKSKAPRLSPAESPDALGIPLLELSPPDALSIPPLELSPPDVQQPDEEVDVSSYLKTDMDTA